jgi:hypothetical protein
MKQSQIGTFKTISLIGIIIVALCAWTCKKSDTVTPTPEPVIEEPTVSGEYNNETTGIKTSFEVNDLIYGKVTGKIADSRPYDGFVGMGIALYDGDKRVFVGNLP